MSALRDPAATPGLIDALAHRDPVVRIGALLALQSRDASAPLAALHALSPSVPGPWLHALVRSGRPMLALEALAMALASAPAEAIELQYEALGPGDASVRIAAASSLDTASQGARARLYLGWTEERDPEAAMHIERLLEGGVG